MIDRSPVTTLRRLDRAHLLFAREQLYTIYIFFLPLLSTYGNIHDFEPCIIVTLTILYSFDVRGAKISHKEIRENLYRAYSRSISLSQERVIIRTRLIPGILFY